MMRFRNLWIFALIMTLEALLTTQALAESRPNRIKIEYIPPTASDHQHVYELMKSRRALEKVQEMFSPARLPIDLWVKMKTCGIVNAWYQRRGRDAVVTICYDYVAAILKELPGMMTPTGLTSMDAIDGQFFYTTAHEMGHAMFDLLDIPIFGRPEDDADQFATYVMLQTGKEDARRLIMAAAYAYSQMIGKTEMAISMKAFSDVHGTAAQRYYNMLCLAYGARPDVFADVVQKGLLPESRAKDCPFEYSELAYAFMRLLRPHLDPKLVKEVMNMEWLPREPEDQP